MDTLNDFSLLLRWYVHIYAVNTLTPKFFPEKLPKIFHLFVAPNSWHINAPIRKNMLSL